MTPRRILGLGLLAAALAAAAPGCASKHKKDASSPPLANPDYAQSLYDQGMREIAARKFRRGRQTFERIQFPASERKRLEPLVRLGIADATFFLGDDASLIEARAKYLDFVLVYGDHPRAAYAQFQAGVCSLKQVRDGTRDQSQTLTAVADFQEVVKRYPDTSYARAARQRIDTAEANLAEHEFAVGKFYLQRKKYAASAQRFRGLLETYPRYRDRPKVYFHLGKALLLANSTAEGRLYLDKLIKDYPKNRYVRDSKRLLAAQDARERAREERKKS